MHWFVLGIIGLTLVVSASRYPRLAFTLLVVLLAVAVIIYQLNLKNDERSDSLISDSEVELSQVIMTPGYAGSYDMKGILRNDSLVSSIVEVVVQIEMLDCPTQGKTDRGNCNGLGWVTARITKNVPPGQKQEFNTNLSFPPSEDSGYITWDYQISQVIGRPHRR
ncbi:MAG: hypothetical protein CNF00_00310 [Candidatus Thioglobus sp. MED-G25]|jgi:hypothetical protein|nr:hypothetical protein [Gammaproteobacteria bacterium]PDH43170.1 MAG: hypothetical protein CNF00_00310 [Candidatus Thioglobus sp. MED-G25]|tara:strand:+ start:88 stop:582 length:495 start_codon:yes stop_codon:yes gene_type:complete